MSCTINRAVVLLAMGRKDDAKSAVVAAKKLGSAFGMASAVFAVQCVMTGASCSAYLSSCALLFLLPELDSNASHDPNGIFLLSKALVPSAWCKEFVDHLSDLSRDAFELAVQHLQSQLQ
jgi:hypothetical protein